jgi:aspartyl/asparaginyl beta-hydroxylase (cupin superfamily)
MFYDPALFDFTQEFERNWSTIRDEYYQLDRHILNLHRNQPHEAYIETLLNNNGWTPSWRAGSSEPNYDWLTYGLSYRGLLPPEAQDKFPTIASLLTRLSGFKVCAFSMMEKLSFIAPHQHEELGGNLLTYHLGIDVIPGKSHLWVNNKFEEQRNGKSIIFDGSCEHFAFNMSGAKRIILYLEFDKTKIAFK